MKVHVDNSWLGYLNSVTLDETWADNVVIQALAVSFNSSIRVVGSKELYVSSVGVLVSTDTVDSYPVNEKKGQKGLFVHSIVLNDPVGRTKARLISGFCSMKRLEALLPPPPWIGC